MYVCQGKNTVASNSRYKDPEAVCLDLDRVCAVRTGVEDGSMDFDLSNSNSRVAIV